MSSLPTELQAHEIRLAPEVLEWIQHNLKAVSLSDFADKIIDLVKTEEVVDAEVAYLACKAGVMTGKLGKVVSLDWEPRHPAVRAYQGLAYLFMNNFTIADKFINQAELEAEKLDDVLLLAEIYGIKIYLYNARYQFFQGVKVIQKAFELLDRGKNRDIVDQNPHFIQWIRISGAKSLLKLGNVPEAIYTNKRALKLANDSFFKSFALLGLGHCFDMVGKTNEAIKNYRLALRYAIDIQANNLLSIIYNRLGMALAWRMDNMNEGETFFSEAIIHAEEGEGLWLKEGPQWNLIALYRAKKDYPSAIKSLENIIEEARKIGESRTELIALLNLAELLEEKNDLNESSKVREAAESLANLIGINVEDFYEFDDEEEDLDEGDIDSEEESFDEFDDIEESRFENDTDYTEMFDNDPLIKKYSLDNDVDEQQDFFPKESDFDKEDDSDDILRKFFNKKR